MFKFLLEAETANPTNSWWIYLILLGLVVVMLVLPSISNRKKAKEYNDMINAIGVGDTVRTVGGIIGRIVKVSEKDGLKTFILETGAKNSKTTMEFDIASIYTVLNCKNKPAVQEEKRAEQKAEEPAETKTETAQETPAEVKQEPQEGEEVKAEKPAKKSSKKTK